MPEALSPRLRLESAASFQGIDPNIRLRDVERITGLSRSTVYRLEAAGAFPKRVKLSVRASAWKVSEVMQWLAERPRAAAPQSAA